MDLDAIRGPMRTRSRPETTRSVYGLTAVPLNFGHNRRKSTVDTATEPRRIFSALPAKNADYAYARDVQSEV